MTPQLSPESLAQIRTIVEAIIARAFEDFERRQNARFETIDRRFEAVNQQFAGLRQETRHLVTENRRHFGVLDEDLRSRMDLIVDGQSGLRETMERGFRATDARIDGLDRRLVRMSARIPVRRRRR